MDDLEQEQLLNSQIVAVSPKVDLPAADVSDEEEVVPVVLVRGKRKPQLLSDLTIQGGSCTAQSAQAARAGTVQEQEACTCTCCLLS